MTEPYIIDAGPALNFFSIRRERLLFETVGPLRMPETVREEILRKAHQEQRFSRSRTVLRGLPESLLEILSDDDSPQLDAVVARVTRIPMSERRRTGKDFGELMVIAHAVVAAEAGAEAGVIIDDGGGAEIATAEVRRLDRLRAEGRPVGSLALIDTSSILRWAVGRNLLKDRGELRSLYEKLRACDDGLRPIGSTDLLSARVWR